MKNLKQLLESKSKKEIFEIHNIVKDHIISGLQFLDIFYEHAQKIYDELDFSSNMQKILNEASDESQTLDQHEVEEEFCTCCRCSPCQCAQQNIDQYISSNC